MRILVCGGRNFNQRDLLFQALSEHNPTLIIEGGARGADRFGRRWAQLNNVPFQTFLPNWVKYGKAAGVLRNKAMLEEGQPDLVIACPGGKGTADMVKRALKAEVRVLQL